MRTIFNLASTAAAGFASPQTSPVMNEFLVLAGAAVAIGASSGNLPMAVTGGLALALAAQQLHTNGKAVLNPAPVPASAPHP